MSRPVLVLLLHSLLVMAKPATATVDKERCHDMRHLFPGENSTTRCYCRRCYPSRCCIGGVCAIFSHNGAWKPSQTCMSGDYDNGMPWPALNKCVRKSRGEVCICNTDFCNKRSLIFNDAKASYSGGITRPAKFKHPDLID